MRKNFNYFFLLSFLTFSSVTFAQQPTLIWPTADQATKNASEFSTAASIFKATKATPNPPAGFTGWTSRGTSAETPDNLDATQWSWSSDNTAKEGALWSSRSPLASPTRANGCALFNSDFLDNAGDSRVFGDGVSPSPHAAELISPRIDAAKGFKNIVVDFHQYYRNFTSECSIQYSNDGGATWSRAVRVNPNVTPGDETETPLVLTNTDSTRKRIILKNVNPTAQFHIKFTFDGDYFFWLIDDIKISGINDFYDLRLTDFLAIPTSFVTPRGQIDTIRFLADIQNFGTKAMSGVKLRVNVVNVTTNRVVYSGETSQYPQPVKGDTTYENRILPTALLPSSLGVGQYIGRYRVLGDSSNQDLDPTNDIFDFIFYISDSASFIVGSNVPNGRGNYVKEIGAISGIRLANSAWATANEPRSSRYGNYFRFNSDKAFVTSITANIYPQAAAGRRLQGSLYELNNDNRDLNVESAERKLVAFGDIEIEPNVSAAPAWFSFPLTDAVDGKSFKPKAKTDYLAVIEFDAPSIARPDDQTNYLFMGASVRTFYYGAGQYVIDSVQKSPRYGIVTGTTADGTWNLRGFEDSTTVFCVRLNVTPFDPTSIKNELSAANKLAISPNPVGADNLLTVEVALEKQADMLMRVYDLSGKLVMEQLFDKFKEQQIRIQTDDYSSGTYILQIITPEGYLTKKFVKAE